ncbi:MAG: hypothetical protein KC454_04380 [Flavobacteriales bacterium]|nr:hypothetical protein [Flavobacteriales bacterium]
MKAFFYTFLSLFVLQACAQDNDNQGQGLIAKSETTQTDIINKEGTTISSRFKVPNGYTRTNISSESFAHYLRRLPLKPHNSVVLTYDGSIKKNYDVYDAVVELKIGKKTIYL